MFKYYFFFIILWLISIVSILVTFFFVGNPLEQKDLSSDNAKVTKIRSIQSSIVNYEIEMKSLPISLDQLKQKYSYIDVVDPETNGIFEYQVVSNFEVKICTNFKTDSVKNPQTGYSYYSNDIKHKKGYDCIFYKIQSLNPISTPTLIPSPMSTYRPIIEEQKEYRVVEGKISQVSLDKTSNKSLYFEIVPSNGQGIMMLVMDYSKLDNPSESLNDLVSTLQIGKYFSVMYYTIKVSGVNYAIKITPVN